MASITMTASYPGGSAAAIAKQPPTIACRRAVAAKAKASKATELENNTISYNSKEESNTKRRELVFSAIAAAAACSIAEAAMAVEPKRGTPEALKKYGPVCASNPTARICRK